MLYRISMSHLAAARLYHGSPYGGLDSFQGVPPPVFLTEDLSVAQTYATKPVMGAQKPPPNAQNKPTIYEIDGSALKMFDMREPANRGLYERLRNRAVALDPSEKEWLPPLRGQGFIMNTTGLPGWGHARGIYQLIKTDGDWDGVLMDDGSHGISYAVFKPEKLHITGRQ